VILRDTDRGYAALMQRVLAIAHPRIAVGIHEAQGAATKKTREEGAPPTVVDVAAWAEFGIGQPERSWLRAWYDGYHRQGHKEIARMLATVIQGRQPMQRGLEQIGQRFVGLIQLRIAQGVPPPNSPVTIRMKGSSKPLIDTGQFRSSITYSVRL
jgi:hypothetical protein